MCPDTVRHDDSPSGSDGPRGGHPGRPAGFGGRSILVASLLGFRSPRTQRPLVHGAFGEERTVTYVPGQKCHLCSRLYRLGLADALHRLGPRSLTECGDNYANTRG
jgi:hypothetical protein